MCSTFFSFLIGIMPNRIYQISRVCRVQTVAVLQTASMSGCEVTVFMHPNHQ